MSWFVLLSLLALCCCIIQTQKNTPANTHIWQSTLSFVESLIEGQWDFYGIVYIRKIVKYLLVNVFGAKNKIKCWPWAIVIHIFTPTSVLALYCSFSGLASSSLKVLLWPASLFSSKKLDCPFPYRSRLSGMSTCQDFVFLFFSLWKKTFWALSFVLLSPLDWPVWLEDTHLLTKKDGVRSGCYCCCWINLSQSDLFWIWLLLNVIKY